MAKPAEPKVPDTQPSPAVQPGGEKEVEAPGGSAPSDTTNFPADTTTAGTYPGSGGSGTDPYSNNNTNSGTGYNNGQNTPPNTGSGSGTGTGTGTGVGTDISKWDGLSFLGNAQWDIQAVP